MEAEGARIPVFAASSGMRTFAKWATFPKAGERTDAGGVWLSIGPVARFESGQDESWPAWVTSPHVHWHVIPRLAKDPAFPKADLGAHTLPPDSQLVPALDTLAHGQPEGMTD